MFLNGIIKFIIITLRELKHDLKEVLKSMQQIPFAPTTVDNVAHKFLSSQEINQFKKPVTLEAMVNLINRKVDIQKSTVKTKK